MHALTPAHVPRRPIAFTVIGGFLGAGKTTALNALLASVADRRIAVLVNDFGDLAIDAALVARRNATTISLNNGCVCCSLAGGLVQGILDAMALAPAPDAIVIEASGVGDPRRIAQIARADPALAPDATIVLVAADQWRALSRDRHVGDLVRTQVAAADILVLNKVDLVAAREMASLRAELRACAPRAAQFETHGARLPYGELLGHTLDAALHGDDAMARPSIGARIGAAPGIADAAPEPLPLTGEDMHARQFATRILRSSSPVSAALLRRALDHLPPSVMRAKGFVRLDETPDAWHLLQLVGSRWTLVPTSPGAGRRESALVVLGPAATLVDAGLAPLSAAFGGAPPCASVRRQPLPVRAVRGR